MTARKTREKLALMALELADIAVDKKPEKKTTKIVVKSHTRRRKKKPKYRHLVIKS